MWKVEKYTANHNAAADAPQYGAPFVTSFIYIPDAGYVSGTDPEYLVNIVYI